MKSEVLSYAALQDVFKDRAQELYDDHAQRAINLYMLGYVLDSASRMSPESEERPYYMAALSILNRLAERGALIQNEGRISIDDAVFDENLSEQIFIPQAEHILTLYDEAERAPDDAIPLIQDKIRILAEQEPHPFVQELIAQVKKSETDQR